MKRLLVIAGIVVAAIVAFFVANVSMDNVDGLAGDPWTLVALKKNGKDADDDEVEGIKLQFTKKAVTWILLTDEGPKGIEGNFQIDLSKQPKAIDIETPFTKMQALRGIYEIKNNLLVIALGDRRPTDFSSRGGLVLVFKR